MRTALGALTLITPRSLDEALRRLQSEGPLLPLAGCTDVYVGLNFGTVKAQRYLNLWGLRGLAGVRRLGDGTLVIGALTTFAALQREPLVVTYLPMLTEAARQIGGVQIQNRATIGGNVANASPAGDSLPVLAAADAVVVVASADRERRIRYRDFHTGYRQTALAPDELILRFEIAPVVGRQWYRKVGTRAANAISKVVLAGIRGRRPRIALGSVGPTVLRTPRTEALLAEDGALEDAEATLKEEISPIDDLRSTRTYRTRVAANLLRQFWEETSE